MSYVQQKKQKKAHMNKFLCWYTLTQSPVTEVVVAVVVIIMLTHCLRNIEYINIR